MLGNDSNQVTSFLKQNEFRYETVAEVNNDWLLIGGNVKNHDKKNDNNDRNDIDMPIVDQNINKYN